MKFSQLHRASTVPDTVCRGPRKKGLSVLMGLVGLVHQQDKHVLVQGMGKTEGSSVAMLVVDMMSLSVVMRL